MIGFFDTCLENLIVVNDYEYCKLLYFIRCGVDLWMIKEVRS